MKKLLKEIFWFNVLIVLCTLVSKVLIMVFNIKFLLDLSFGDIAGCCIIFVWLNIIFNEFKNKI